MFAEFFVFRANSVKHFCKQRNTLAPGAVGRTRAETVKTARKLCIYTRAPRQASKRWTEQNRTEQSNKIMNVSCLAGAAAGLGNGWAVSNAIVYTHIHSSHRQRRRHRHHRWPAEQLASNTQCNCIHQSMRFRNAHVNLCTSPFGWCLPLIPGNRCRLAMCACANCFLLRLGCGERNAERRAIEEKSEYIL